MVSAEEFSQRRPYNAASDFIDANIAQGRASKPAFIDGKRTLSYGELQTQSQRFAHGLRALGLRQESRIALLLLDTVDYPVAFWGAIRAGVVCIPLNTLLTPEQYLYMLDDSRAEAVFVSAPLLKSIEPILSKLANLRLIVVAGSDGAVPKEIAGREALAFETVLERGKTDSWTAPTISDEIAFWLYSSGSTGQPKGAKHVHSSLMATAKLYGQGVLGIREDDVVYSAAKIFFAYGLGNAMSFPMSVGATTILLPERPAPDAIFALWHRKETQRIDQIERVLRARVWATGAVVEQQIDVETGDHLMPGVLQHMVDHPLAGAPGVHEAGHGIYEDRRVQLGHLAGPLEKTLRVKHVDILW
jgi:4-hydroxybenzoate-CoA ligase